MEDGRPVNVATCYGDLMTRSWAELLLENGVPAMVKTGGPGFSLGGPPPFGFPSYIYVPSTHAARARDILKDFAERGQLEVNDDE